MTPYPPRGFPVGLGRGRSSLAASDSPPGASRSPTLRVGARGVATVHKRERWGRGGRAARWAFTDALYQGASVKSPCFAVRMRRASAVRGASKRTRRHGCAWTCTKIPRKNLLEFCGDRLGPCGGERYRIPCGSPAPREQPVGRAGACSGPLSSRDEAAWTRRSTAQDPARAPTHAGGSSTTDASPPASPLGFGR